MNLNLHFKYGTNRHALNKPLLVMKLIVILLTTAIMQVSASTLAQKITISKIKAPLSQIIKEIRNQSGYYFFYNNDVLKGSNPVTIDVKDASIDDVLKECFKDQPLEFEIKEKTVLIKYKEKSLFAKVMAVIMAKNIQGRILDQDGNPLAGATINVLGTTIVTTSNLDGYFGIPGVKEDAIIRISYIGYVSQDVKVSTGLFAVKLVLSESKLDEIKVIAYGTTTARTSTGDITTVSAKDIATQPVNNILDALSGRVAGLQITPTSGIIGAAPNVLVQGRSSLGNAANVPLYLIDGVPAMPSQAILNAKGGIDNQSLNLLFGLNPLDVESISVLKDADATAIYGSRGANGVIIITTKHGKFNGTQVNLNAYTGFSQVSHFTDLLDVHQYNAMRREAFKNDGFVPNNNSTDYNAYAPDLFQSGGFDSTKTHNWQKELIGKTAVAQDVNLSLSGGSESTHFYVSSALHQEGSVMPGDNKSTRKSFLARIDHTSDDKKFNIGIQANYSTTNINVLAQDLVQYTTYAPSYQLYNPDGTLNWSSGQSPVAYTLQKYSLPTTNFGGSANLSYQIIKGLKAKVNAGFNTSNLEMAYQQPLSSFNPAGFQPVSTLTEQTSKNNNWIVEPQLEYIRGFGKHHLELLAGSTYQKTKNENLYLIGTNFANDALLGNIGSAGTKTVTSNNTPYAYNAVFGRVSYNYNQEYLADATFRRDGSSKFGPGKKFGNFGALGLGWVFTQEKAVTDLLPFLSFGKIRATYGITGNDQIIDFGYISTVSSSASGYNGQPVLRPTTPDNPDLQWETNKKMEIGLELGFLKDRIFLSTSYFRNRTSNQLISEPLSTQSGFVSYPANWPAVVENKGLEIELTTHNLQGKFSWNTSFNLTKSGNTLVSYPNFANSSYKSTYVIGQPLSIIQSYKLLGLDKTGAPVFADLNNDGKIDANDRVLNGNNNPFYGGIKNDFSFKGFNLGFFIQYNRYRGVESYLPTATGAAGQQNFNTNTYSLGRWQRPGDEANTIILPFTTNYSPYYQYPGADQLVATRNIFRLSNASISYTIPTDIIRYLKMSRLQVYVNAQNLYVWDSHKADELDPQTGNNALPLLRTIVFGINATF